MKSRISVVLAIFASGLLVNCGGGGGGGGGNSGNAPCILAQKLDFPPGSAPSGFNTSAAVLVLDNSCSSPITNASVTVNGVPLVYNIANQDYEANVVVAPGGTVSLQVSVGGTTYAASATQFTSYPTISAPIATATWSSLLPNVIGWSGGGPTTNSAYAIGILDAADPNGQLIWPTFNTFDFEDPGTNSVTVPTNALTAGNRLVWVGLLTALPIPGAAGGSFLAIGGFNYAPITVVDNKLPGLQSITVAPSGLAVGKGTTQQLTATGLISDNTLMDVTGLVTWSSSDSTVAAVNSAGMLTGATLGSVTITASHAGIAGTASARIVPGLMAGVTYSNPFNPVGEEFIIRNTAVGDLNGDGRNDVAGVMGNGDILVYYQNAQGTLDPPQHITTDLFLQGIAIADVNNDGLADLIVSGNSTTATSGFLGRVTVFLQDGVAHAPGAPQEYTISTNAAGSLAVADLNGDSLPDIVTAGGSDVGGVVSLFFQGTGGTLGPEVTYTHVTVEFDANGTPGELHVADMDNDGRNDIVLQNGPGEFAVIRQLSAGTFSTSPDLYAVPNSCSCFKSFALGDLNGDGLTDVAVADPGGGVSILLRNGVGILGWSTVQSITGSTQEVRVADVDGDGLNDLVLLPFPPSNLSDWGVQVMYQAGDHSFSSTGSYSLAGCTPFVLVHQGVSIGDVTGDGLADIVASCSPGGAAVLVLPRAP